MTFDLWTVAGIAAVLVLILFARTKNSVWGASTGGLLIGLIVSFFTGFAWWTLWKGAIIGTGVGLLVELPRTWRALNLRYLEFRRDRAAARLQQAYRQANDNIREIAEKARRQRADKPPL